MSTDDAADQAIVLSDRGHGIWTAKLNRPERLNAVTSEVLDTFRSAVETLPDRGGRALVVHGEGRAFSAGGDIKVLRTLDARAREGYLAGYARLSDAIAESALLVVAAVDGLAYGGGFELACMVDVRVADPAADFCVGDIAIGLLPTGGLTWKLPRMIGRGRASWMFLTNAVVPATQAYEIGLCDVLSQPGRSLQEALALAAEACRFSASAISDTKRALHRAEEHDQRDSMDFEIATNAVGLDRPEVVEQLRRFGR